jgi:hypothetical protein
MKDNTKHIIARLKQQPRQGLPDDPGLLDAYGKGLEAATSKTNVFLGGLGQVSATLKDQGEKYIGLVNKMSQYEEANKSLQETFGLNIGQAAEMGATLDNLAKSFGVGGAKLRKYQGDLKGLIGGFAGVTKNIGGSLQPLLRTQNIIQTNLKLSGEQANKFIQYAAMVGESADTQLLKYGELAKTISDTTGMQVSARDLVADLAGMTEDLQLQYGKIPEKLALANLKAKALGVSMTDLANTGKNLLNIESSIGQELEYQLLSGHRLVDNQGQSLTNAYRTATIQGDSNKQAELYNQIIEQEGETLRNNMFARQQMAQMLGTDEATIARTLSKQKLLSDLGVSEFVNESFEDIRAEVMKSDAYKTLSPEEQAKKLKELFDSTDTRTTDQKMLDRLDSFVTDGIRIMTDADPKEMQALVDRRAKDALEAQLAFNEAGSAEAFTKDRIDAVGKTITTTQTGFGAAAAAKDFATAIGSALTGAEFTNPWTIRASDVTLSTNAVDGNDVALPAGSNRAIFGPEGMINLNKKDSIIAGTDLFGQSSGGGSSDVAALAAAIIGAINKQTDALTTNSRMNGQYWS